MKIIKFEPKLSIYAEEIENLDYIKFDAEPHLVQVLSEPMLVLSKRGYQPIVRIMHKKKKTEYLMFISAVSLSQQLENLRIKNNGQFTGLEFWIRKESYDKKSQYILEEY